jgi:formate-nitrite transporter family protein
VNSQPLSTVAKNLVLPIVERDHIQGPTDAPLALVEYGDYECPRCGAAYPIVKAVQEQLGDRLCFAFRNFPLMNAHPHSARAAEAAEAAGAQGRFWPMHDMLLENQGALEDRHFAKYARKLGLDADRLIADLMNATHTLRVREDIRSGARAGVNGTPTFFINGVRYDGPLNEEALFTNLVAKARMAPIN